jgi:hypothetical protein
VLVPSSRMPVRMRLTGQLGRRGDEASWHRSSRRAAVAVGEMAFTREEENGMGEGVRSAHDQVEEEEGGSGLASSSDSRSTTTRARWPREWLL